MAQEKSIQASLLIFTLITGLISQSLVIPVISAASFQDQKNHYPPGDPHTDGSPPKGVLSLVSIFLSSDFRQLLFSELYESYLPKVLFVRVQLFNTLVHET